MTDIDVTWPSLVRAWYAGASWPERRPVLDRAVAYARRDASAFWDWFLTLGPESRTNGSLLTNVLSRWRGSAPVPERASAAMLRAAVEEHDPSFNRVFVEPCARAYGRRAVVEALVPLVEGGAAAEQAGAARALYWAQLGSGELGDALDRMRVAFLRTFVETNDLHVRRAILGQLSLDANDYPDEVRPLVTEAIAIGRGSDDDYLRHRVEIQLGRPGPFLPLPSREP